MIKKHRTVPIRLLMEEALSRRLPASHPKQKELAVQRRKNRAGYKGEKNLDYELRFLPEQDFVIFQDLSLSAGMDRHFQLDALVLSRSCAVIVETKNIYGRLFFDTKSGQLTRTFDQITEGFPDPLMQAKKQQALFLEWLSSHLFKPLPVYHLIAIGSPSTIIETNDPAVHKKVLHAAHIPDKILELQETVQNSSPSPPLTSHALDRLSEQLLAAHQPPIPDILQRWQIDPATTPFVQGVFCPACETPGMVKQRTHWICPTCGCRDKNAHFPAVMDYLLLFRRMTRKECFRFLQTGSEDTAKRLLLSMGLPFEGTGKRRAYVLSPPLLTIYDSHRWQFPDKSI